MKKLFMISVTDKKDSLNREFSDSIRELLNNKSSFTGEYKIESHVNTNSENLQESLCNAIKGNEYEGYIIILDCLDVTKGLCNPNVMFEFGAINYLQKPFAVVAAHRDEKFPFDVENLNIEFIPECILSYIEQCHNTPSKVEVTKHFFMDSDNTKDLSEIHDFLGRTYNKYKESLEKKPQELDNINNSLIWGELLQIKKLLSNTAEYIDGEAEAFNALKEAVSGAKYSLRTSRFANETIVADKPSKQQNEFMSSLYDKSNSLTNEFVRIICNNHPLKWHDIYNILLIGGNGSKIYVRKADFSIHFELVVIDERVAFIHFYQKDYESNKEEKNSKVEKINSTLKIQGSSICQKLANIFDRLHHRDFDKKSPEVPSRTLLGIPMGEEELKPKYIHNGCFMLDETVPKYIDYAPNFVRRNTIKSMFRKAFEEWEFDNDVDKINMVVGIALIEESRDFISKMHNEKLNDDEYENALELYDKYSFK